MASSGDRGADATAGGAAASAPGSGAPGEPEPGSRAHGSAGSQTASRDGVDGAPSSTSASTGGAEVGSTGYRPPPDVGSGEDDDTLAAQLRELAMKETDPVLRERYWEEYRKHKGIK
ncbi:MAG TPA: hypothetical protein VEC18_01000 [Myxococcota bacterium]|nr:hypothetical protein [Myxococcota bacterium]